MPTFQITVSPQFSNRTELRNALITTFMGERSGYEAGETTYYVYTVERYGDYSVFLKRPGKINKGFDFAVSISSILFRDKIKAHAEPNFDNVFFALTYCKEHYSDIYEQSIKLIINDIYNCRPYNPTPQQNLDVYFFNRYDQRLYPIELILLALKWLFAEQDFTYWNYSGRARLYGELQSRNLV